MERFARRHLKLPFVYYVNMENTAPPVGAKNVVLCGEMRLTVRRIFSWKYGSR